MIQRVSSGQWSGLVLQKSVSDRILYIRLGPAAGYLDRVGTSLDVNNMHSYMNHEVHALNTTQTIDNNSHWKFLLKPHGYGLDQLSFNGPQILANGRSMSKCANSGQRCSPFHLWLQFVASLSSAFWHVALLDSMWVPKIGVPPIDGL